MAVYNPNGSGGVHNDQILTNISLAYDQGEFVGEKLAPSVVVKKQSDKYRVFGKETFTPETSDFRAPGTLANEIPGMLVSKDSYYATEHALQIAITDEERRNADSPLSPDRDGTEIVTQKILLGRELAIMNMVTNTNNYATGLSKTISGTAQWDKYDTSDPIKDVKDAIRAVHAKSFKFVNTAVIPYQVMSILEDHPDILERIRYTRDGILTPQLIASVLGLDNVIVPGVAVGNGRGFDVTTSYLWGKNVVLAYVPKSAGMRVPAFMYEFVWGSGGKAMTVDRWREEPRKSDIIRASRSYDLKMVGVEISPSSADFNKSITGYVIKNAIA